MTLKSSKYITPKHNMIINNGCNLPFSNLIWLQPFVPRDQLFLYHRTANKNQTSYNYIYTLYVEYCNPHFLWVRPSCLLLLWQSEQSCEQTTTEMSAIVSQSTTPRIVPLFL